MSDINGGPAFPVPEEFCTPGMTLRDYFAAQAVAVAMSCPIDPFTFVRITDYSERAVIAYKMADAMLAARDGGEAK